MAQVKDLVVHCIDFRFRRQIADWIAEHLNDQADVVAIAGVSKAINEEHSQHVVLSQLEIAKQLHGMDTVHLLAHVDCGAYGGSKEHPHKEAEVAMHKEKLEQAAEVIKNRLPDLTIKVYLVDFDGIQPLS